MRENILASDTFPYHIFTSINVNLSNRFLLEADMLKKLDLLIPPLPLTIVLCVIIAFSDHYFPEYSLTIPSAIEWGFAFWVVGIAFVLPAATSFFKAKTTVDPRTPEKTKALVITGLYKVSRNPMYVGFLFVIVGTACFYQHISGVIISVIFIPYMNRFQITLEEQHLHRNFGDEYEQYCKRVRRWL